MNGKEGLNSVETLAQGERDFHFAMKCNGYFLSRKGNWWFDPKAIESLVEEFRSQQASFFGPNPPDSFFSVGQRDQLNPVRLIAAFKQQAVTDVIGKYREVNEDQAVRIAFLLGSIVRHFTAKFLNPQDGTAKIPKAVKFAANMTKLGERRSSDAIVSAVAMYIISGGSLAENNIFTGWVYHMVDAIREDPIVPLETSDLGLSQVARLRTFLDKIQAKEQRPFPDIGQYKVAFDGFPTVGAEFHFSRNAPTEYPNFWQRLAILNMSQYQRGSYIPLCRNDRDVIEVRMNPSIYPVAIANWNHIRLILPELNQTFFTVTINRTREDFNWKSREDKNLLNYLRALGLLCYAGIFENIPQTEGREEINFGQVYLGQTVKMRSGEYEFSGNWSGGEGQEGQLAIYAGYGDIFPHLAYYLSMALANPDILESVSEFLLKIRTLRGALDEAPVDRSAVFRAIQNRVQADARLCKAFEAGTRIVELLNS